MGHDQPPTYDAAYPGSCAPVFHQASSPHACRPSTSLPAVNAPYVEPVALEEPQTGTQKVGPSVSSARCTNP